MGNPLILSIDCGTQSLRAILFDENGEIQGKVQKPFEPPYFSVSPGWAEQEPLFYYDALCCSVNRLKSEKPDLFGNIIGVCVTTQRDTMCFLGKSGESVRPAILWLDQREAPVKLKDKVKPHEYMMFKAVHMTESLESVVKMGRPEWVKANEPENWAKTDKTVFLSCFLNYRLTGKMADSIANIIGHVPFDVKVPGWAKESDFKYRCFGIGKDKLPELIPSGELLGKITAAAARETGIPEGLPVYAAASDKGAETLGNGAITEDVASISFGTTATVQLTTKKYVEPLSFIPPYPAAIAGYYNPEFQVYRGYWMINWFKKEFAAHEIEEAAKTGARPEALLDRRLKEIPPGCDGLMLQPYWTPGIKMVNAKGAIIGFNDSHNRIHLYRAIIEGINYALMDGMGMIQAKTKTPVTKIALSGGGAQSDEVGRITADMFGLPVCRVQTFETSGLGAAIIGFVAAGVYKDYNEAVGKMVRNISVFEPDPENAATYKRLYDEVYRNMFKSLSPMYKTIKGILKIN
ncbi:MAG: FGGY-family carbohydrate kinase [Oscillospiraceae bacterium]|nr:FGGY-family carbohydrate kinase [Oscillospiraceae bacterium]